jgi:hypothetical protein
MKLLSILLALALLAVISQALTVRADDPVRVSLPWRGRNVSDYPNPSPGTGYTVYFTGNLNNASDGCGSDSLYAIYEGTLNTSSAGLCPHSVMSIYITDSDSGI